MSQDTFYWLSSTIAQTYGAIIGVIGLLTVYRLENYRNLRAELRHRQMSMTVKIFGGRALAWPPYKMIDHFRHPAQEERARMKKVGSESEEAFGNFIYDITAMETAQNWCDITRNHFKTFLLYHLTLVAVSLIAIYFVPVRTVLSDLSENSVIALLVILTVVLVISWILTMALALYLIKGIEEKSDKAGVSIRIHEYLDGRESL